MLQHKSLFEVHETVRNIFMIVLAVIPLLRRVRITCITGVIRVLCLYDWPKMVDSLNSLD